MSCSNGNFLNMTNNRLESLNGKLKSVIQKFSSMKSFVENLFCVILSIRQERDHKMSTDFLKVPAIKFPAGSAEEQFSEVLNPYPFRALLNQLNLSKDNKITVSTDDGFFYDCQGKSYGVSPDMCQCVWFKAMKLPCRHVFSVRRKLDMNLYDPALCHERWLKRHLVSVHRTFNTSSDITPMYKETAMLTNVPKTSNARFSYINSFLQRLASTAADSTGEEFVEKVDAVKQLLR